ncbi:MAG: 30S ribosomal protein S6 [Oscillospiraceae bacterium]|nr:30S ribosomal protein S6 [Oscillospiraceae bacterium]
MYIIDPAQGEEAIAATVEKFKALAEKHSSVVEVEEWGKRKLAYAIDYKTEGYYVLMSFTSDPEFPKELDRVLGITDGILRSMIVCKGE